MDIVLPYRIKNEFKFYECAFKLGFDEMSVHKFLYMFHQFDVDTFPKMGDDRLSILIYGWVLCEEYLQSLARDEWELPDEIEFMVKILVPWSLDIWFSKEWERCKPMLRYGLIHCLNKARTMLMRSPDMMQLNWEFLLLYNQTPWQVAYLKSLNVKKEKTLETGGQTIEMEEMPANSEDIQYIKLEQFPLIVLRMVKLFDQGSIDMVKTLSMRVLSAWNKIYHTEVETAGSRLPYVPPEDKRCLLLICHIYLMAVYEADDVKGYVLDNMINNIRFYYQCFQSNTATYAMDNLGYTPARFIALTAAHLRLQKRELFDFYIWNCAETSPVNLFGVVAQAYKSYLLGNLLMELNNLNEESLALNAALYKRLINAYVNEREKSELFVSGEIRKLEAQRYAHNIDHKVYITDFKSKICKGNRMGNICNYENFDDVVRPREYEKVNKEAKACDEDVADDDDELSVKQTGNELSVDPIFQNIPNNEEILYYVYEVLSKKNYRGWQFAKIVLLFKIISHELNMLETWRYHPGLTINFMLHLEMKLSQHYIDLAKIFKDYPFMEQEFWLTAFYLHPTQQSYEAVKRLGIRNNRKRNEEPNVWSPGKETIDTKFGLLSSTIDVKEIVSLTNSDDQNADYMPLTKALHSLHLPDSVVKDILTVIFLPRNRSFSWAVEWNDLRRRCKMLMTNMSEKKRFVELTMAEANDRLKFLNINYAKYKNRPQLDYGSIEQGYEHENVSGDIELPTDNSDEEEEDFEDDEDVYEGKKPNSRSHKKQDTFEVEDEENSQEDDPYLVGKRRTRARTAAAMASLLSSSEITTRRKRKLLEEEMRENEEKSSDIEEKSNDSKIAEAIAPPPPLDDTMSTSENPEIQKRNIKECLQEKPLILNTTDGFRPLIDTWNVEKSEFQSIDKTCVSLLESSQILNRFAKLKSINKQINTTSTMEDEEIDEVEMVIKHVTLRSEAEETLNRNPEMTETHADSAKEIDVICATNDSAETKTHKSMSIPDKDSKDNSVNHKMSKLMEETKKIEQCFNQENAEENNQMDVDNRINQIVLKDADSEITHDTPPNFMESLTSDQTMNEQQESPREIVSPNDIAKDVQSEEVIMANEECESVIEAGDVCTSLADLKESGVKTLVSVLNTEPSVPIQAEKQHPPTCNEMVTDQLSSIEMQESKQESVTLPSTIGSEVMPEEVSVVQESNVASMPSSGELNDGLEQISLGKKLLDETLESSKIKPIEMAASSCHKNRSDDEANPATHKELKLSMNTEDDTQLEDSENIMSAEDPKMEDEGNFDLSSFDISMQFSDDIKSVLKEALNDVIPSDAVAEECQSRLNEASKTTLESEELMETKENYGDNELSVKIFEDNQTMSVAELPKCSEKIESSEKEIEDENQQLTSPDLENTLNEASTVKQDSSFEGELGSDVTKSIMDSQNDLDKVSLYDIENDNPSMHDEEFGDTKCPVNNAEELKNDEQSKLSSKDLEQMATVAESPAVRPLEEVSLELEDIKHVQETTDNTMKVSDIDATQVNILPVAISPDARDNEIEDTIDISENINTDTALQISIKHQMTTADDSNKSPEDISTDVPCSTPGIIFELEANKIEEKTEDNAVLVMKITENVSTNLELKISDTITFEENADCNDSVDVTTALNKPVDEMTVDENIIVSEKAILESENENEKITEPANSINTDVDLKISDKSTFDLGENKSEELSDYYSSGDGAPKSTLKLSNDEFEKMSTVDQIVDKSEIETELGEKSEKTNKSTPVEENVSNDLQPLGVYQNFTQLDIVLDKNNESTGMPSLRWDDNILNMDVTTSQIGDANVVTTLESDESKDKPFVQISIENTTNGGPSPQEVKELNNELKKRLKPLRVILCRLKPSDLVNLRQPIVRVKRCRDMEAAPEEIVPEEVLPNDVVPEEVIPEEVLPKKRRVRRKFFIEIEGSSDSLSNSSCSSMYRPPGRSMKPDPSKRKIPRQNRNSDSDFDSNNSFSASKKRRTSTPNAQSNHSNISAKSSSRSSAGNSGILVVTPRSASGLKLRISHADQKPTHCTKFEPIVVDEVIQVSSSTSDESDTMDSILEVPEDEADPLYEEAVIDLNRRR